MKQASDQDPQKLMPGMPLRLYLHLSLSLWLIVGAPLFLLGSLNVFREAWGWIWPALLLLFGGGWLIRELFRPGHTWAGVFLPVLTLLLGFVSCYGKLGWPPSVGTGSGLPW